MEAKVEIWEVQGRLQPNTAGRREKKILDGAKYLSSFSQF